MCYKKIAHCTRYHSYQFSLPLHWQQHQFALMRDYVLNLGENRYPDDFEVLQIRHELFMIDFPGYGFPYFKVNFYPDTKQQQQQYYLGLLVNQLHYAERE